MEDKKIASNSMSSNSQLQIDTTLNETETNNPESNTGYASQAGPSTALALIPKPPTSGAREGLPPGASLASIFRYHMGIESDSELVPDHLAKKRSIDPIATGVFQGRRAVNLGIYNRAIREERSSILQYQIWSVVINSALGMQIVFAAILTALGASNSSHDAVTIFGALNTVIAGFLTYLKGTGLPMRMKYFHNQWLKLRAYIEQRERDFASDDHMSIHKFGYTELMEEVHVIEKMYQNIRKDVERHTPDNFSGSRADNTDAPGEGAPESSLAKMGLNAFKAKLSGGGGAANNAPNGVEGRIKSAVEDVERRISSHLSKHLTGLQKDPQNRVDYGATSTQSMTRNQPGDKEPDLEANEEEIDSDSNDMSKMELDRMKQKQEQAQAAQREAELKIQELEQKLKAMSDTTSENKQRE